MILAAILLVLAGALLCNAIPHLARGLTGARFPTPFARPPGVGESSPLVNMLWGWANLFAGVALVTWQMPETDTPTALIALALGFVAIGAYLARHFGAVRGGATKT